MKKWNNALDWVPGDLYIGGKGLALEYLNKPEETMHTLGMMTVIRKEYIKLEILVDIGQMEQLNLWGGKIPR